MKDDPSKEPTPRTEQNEEGVPFSVGGKRLTRRDFMLLSGMSAASLLLAGCGGGGGNTSTSKAVLQPNAIVLPTDGSVTVSNPSPNQITLSGNVPPITTSNVIVDPTPPGHIYKVTGVSNLTKGGVSLQTTQGTLEDVFQEANLQITKQLSASDISNLSSAQKRLLMTGNTRDGRDIGFKISFPSMDLGNGVSLTISGTFDAGLDMNVSIGLSGFPPLPSIQSAHVILNMGVSLTASIEATLLNISIDEKVQLNNPAWILDSILLCEFPPIWITPTLTLYSLAKAEFKEKISMSGTISLNGQAGLQYTKNSGWKPVLSGSVTDTSTPPELIADLDFDLTTLRAELAFELESAAGPYINEDLPQYELKVSQSSSPTGVEVKLTDKFDVDVGCKVDALGYTLADVSLPGLTLHEDTIYDHVFASQGQANVGIQ